MRGGISAFRQFYATWIVGMKLTVMTFEDEKKHVIEELENVLATNGRGRPIKFAKEILWIIDCHGQDIFRQSLKEISQRKR